MPGSVLAPAAAQWWQVLTRCTHKHTFSYPCAGQLEAQAAALINQQLASMQPVPDPEDEVPEAPTVRVSLQMQQARRSNPMILFLW